MTFPQLDTPCLTVDRDLVIRHVQEMQAYCDAHGLALRPHIKTHKTRELAKMQVELGATGLTYQKLGEVEALHQPGVDTLVSYNIVGTRKLDRLVTLATELPLSVTVDDVEVAEAISAALAERSGHIGVWIDSDTGLGRTGVQDAAQALELAARVNALPALQLRGLFTYPTPPPGSWFEEAIEGWRQAGLPGPEISVGGTPDAFSTHNRNYATELRAGTYVFMDLNCVHDGSATLPDCALTVLTTCVSRPTRDRAIVDAGSKSLGLEVVDLGVGPVFGVAQDRPSVHVREVYEEHGILASSDPTALPEIGERVAIVPTHCCVSVNLHERMFVTCDGEVVDQWSIAARGRVQ